MGPTGIAPARSVGYKPVMLRASSVVALLLSIAGGAHAASPHRSYERLVTGNGHVVASYSTSARKIDTFLEHPYRFRAPRPEDVNDLCFSAVETRDLAFDSYFGVRSGAGVDERGQWLDALALVEHGYEPGTGIIRTRQAAGAAAELVVETYSFAPMDLEQPVLLQLARVVNTSGAPVSASVYALFNFHLGAAVGGARDPEATNEQVIAAGGALPAFTFYEYSDESEGTMAYVALSPIAHHSVNGAFARLGALQDLDDVPATSGPSYDVAPGLQGPSTALAPSEELWFAAAVVWAADSSAQEDVESLLAWVDGRSAQQLLDDERAAWSAWHTPPPAGLDDEQRALWRQQAALLRMGQVREPGASFGQILASLPPGEGDPGAQWNIAWVRDMAYAVTGLARAGHLDEAWAALRFQLEAGPGLHTDVVGDAYRISVTRYFGDGTEESDCNEDGPNIEYDGFGLFLWSLGELLRAGGDPSLVDPYWPIIENEIGDVLLSLIANDGVIEADSSIWEVHWNGRQRKFTYTSLAAAVGFCELAAVATALGESEDAVNYRYAGALVRDSVIARHTDGDGVLAQSAEDLASGQSYVDAATVEAINWGVIDPGGAVASATLDRLLAALAVDGTPGLMRNDDGGWYDSQEWVFIGLRLVPALYAAGRAAKADELLAWIEAQATLNDLQLAELFEATTGDYAGSIPMLGFGAGAYLIARSTSPVLAPACGAYATWPPAPAPDAGVAPDDAGPPLDDAGPPLDDAGPPLDDAGPPLDDAGPPLLDAGDDDAGPAAHADAGPVGPLPRRDAGDGDDPPAGCACSQGRGEDARAPSTWCLACALVLVAQLRRRRS